MLCRMLDNTPMMKLLLLLPLLFLATVAVAEKRDTLSEAAAFAAVSKGKFKDFEIGGTYTDAVAEDAEYYINTLEPRDACAGFDLTEAEVREFFKRAHFVVPASREDKKIDHDGESRCRVVGSLVLQNGKKIDWIIERSRVGRLTFSKESGNSGWPYKYVRIRCDTCEGMKFYPKGKQLSDYRPIVKSVTFGDNTNVDMSAADPSVCKQFKLTEADVSEFFRIAYPSSETEFKNEAFDIYGNPYCSEDGKAVLLDGREVEWYIKKTRTGFMHIPGENGRTLYFYCKDCSVKKYGKECDIECYQKSLE